MYDDKKKFSKRHWYGLLFLMVVLGLMALQQSQDTDETSQPVTTPDVYPEFGMMYDASGQAGVVYTGSTSGMVNGQYVSRMPVAYNLSNGYAVYQGDILLNLDGPAQAGLGIKPESYLWPNNLIPYQIDPRLPDQKRIHDAIAHWEANTPIRFVERTDANASQYPNYVKFIPSQGCASYVGMQGDNNPRLREQPIMLAPACTTGNTIHEIGHAVGVWHEQSRADRDEYVDVRYENIVSLYRHNFDKQIDNGVDIGEYDYGSIMHYPRWAFSKNGEDTIVPHGNQEIGQRDGLSAGDIGAIVTMYGDADQTVAADHYSMPMHDDAGDMAFDCYPGH